jgi:hypothetical protein
LRRQRVAAAIRSVIAPPAGAEYRHEKPKT